MRGWIGAGAMVQPVKPLSRAIVAQKRMFKVERLFICRETTTDSPANIVKKRKCGLRQFRILD